MSKSVQYMTEAELDVYKGLRTKRAEAVREGMIKQAVGSVLGLETEMVLPTGEKVVVTFADKLAVRTVMEAIDNPSTSKLKDLSSVMNENKITVEHTGGADFFMGICAGDELPEEGDGSDTVG